MDEMPSYVPMLRRPGCAGSARRRFRHPAEGPDGGPVGLQPVSRGMRQKSAPAVPSNGDHLTGTLPRRKMQMAVGEDGLIMATVRAEAVIRVPAERVWDAIADVGAVHRRLLPGRVTDARIEDDTRVLTMPDGSEIRELIVSIDHHSRRLAYAVVEGQKLPVTYHHATFQVFDEGEHSRLI